MKMSDKILLAIITAVMFVVACMYVKVLNELYRKDAEISRLTLALNECGIREKGAIAMVERQNAAIDAVRVDTVYIDRLIKVAEAKYAEIREVVVRSIEKDSSYENKVNSIDVVLRRFHGVELRPADSD